MSSCWQSLFLSPPAAPPAALLSAAAVLICRSDFFNCFRIRSLVINNKGYKAPNILEREAALVTKVIKCLLRLLLLLLSPISSSCAAATAAATASLATLLLFLSSFFSKLHMAYEETRSLLVLLRLLCLLWGAHLPCVNKRVNSRQLLSLCWDKNAMEGAVCV